MGDIKMPDTTTENHQPVHDGAAELLTSELEGRSALVVAHPGHELRVYGWLELFQPVEFIITDGSGHEGRGRIDQTLSLLNEVGAEAGGLFGRFSDKIIYRALMNKDFRLFIEIIDELVDQLIAAKIEYVVGDALEGYNPTHDVCRLVIGAALERVKQLQGYVIRNYGFPLVGLPCDCPNDRHDDAKLAFELDKQVLDRKLAAARSYGERHREIAVEVESALKIAGLDGFRSEYFFPMNNDVGYVRKELHRPFYEIYGEQQVAKGYYDKVLRYHEHVLPLVNKLWEYVRPSA